MYKEVDPRLNAVDDVFSGFVKSVRTSRDIGNLLTKTLQLETQIVANVSGS